MGPLLYPLVAAVTIVGVVVLAVVFAEIKGRRKRSDTTAAQAVLSDTPKVLPEDVGIIRIKLPNGVSAAPHIQFKIGNYGTANAVLRRVQSRFMMLELPLTKEKVNADNVKPGETITSTWMNSSILKPGDIVETGPFGIPQHIKISIHEGRFGTPRLDRPEQLFVFVTIEYHDLAENSWIGHSCWKYEHPYGIFARYPGNEWNYQERRS
jgi:hypothetical protein